MARRVLLATFSTEFEAQLVRTKLERHGITAVIESPELAHIIPVVEFTNGLKVTVDPADLEAAQAVIRNEEDALAEDMDTSGDEPAD